jgi:hypothetical protein
LCIQNRKLVGYHLFDGDSNHTCDILQNAVMKYKSPAANYAFLTQYLKDYIIRGEVSNIKLVEIVKEKLGCDVSTSTITRVLQKASKTYLNGDDKYYSLLKPYELKINELGGYAILRTKPLPNLEGYENAFSFDSIYVCLKQQREYPPFIKYICLDAGHLRGKHGGVLLMASTLDSDGRLVILAQCIASKENKDNSEFFTTFD